MTKIRQAIYLAYERGYRVTEDGRLINSKGDSLVVKRRGNQRYPTFSLNDKNMSNSGVFGIPVHRFAGYCFYGNEVFKDGIVIRHLDADTENISKVNLVLGTHSENNLDKCPNVRRMAAIKARASQGYRPNNAKLNDGQVREIRERYAKGESGYSICRDYGISNVTVYNIINRKRYVDVE